MLLRSRRLQLLPFLIVAALLACLTTAKAQGNSVPETREEPSARLTPEEEREALTAAEQVMSLIREKQDISPLIGEMFVSDFPERLPKMAAHGSLLFLGEGVIERAERDDLTRYYVAFNNLLLWGGMYYADAEERLRANAPEGAEDDLSLEDALPLDVLELFKNDPLLRPLFASEEKTREAGNAVTANKWGGQESESKIDDEADTRFIKTVEQLRALTQTLEKAIDLYRRHLSSAQVKQVLKRFRATAQEDGSTLMRPRLTVLSKDWYGYPRGTRVVCVDVLLFHVDFIKIEDTYKILALYFSGD